jgi:hypothetical protein
MKTQLSCFPHGGLTIRLISIKTTWPVLLVSLCLGLLLWSCNINPSLQEVTQPKGNLAVADTKLVSSASLLPGTVSLDKVDLSFDVGYRVTGSLLVEIRDSQTNAVVGSVNVPVSSLAIGRFWNTFTFSPALSLVRGNKYQIQIIRSDNHDFFANNYIFWRSSLIDAYPDGGPLGQMDFAFKTYTNGGIDQQQTLINYGSGLGNRSAFSQEFKADYPKVLLRTIFLNLSLGQNVSDTELLNMEIRSADGSTVIGSTVITVIGSTVIGKFRGQIFYDTAGYTGWIKFPFSTIPSLYRDQTYRIYVTRSGHDNYLNGDYILWWASTGGVDIYPDGTNDVYPSQTVDYTFRTYTGLGFTPMVGSGIGGLLDQHQDQTDYTFGYRASILNSTPRWQEFIPRRQ